MGKTMHLTQKEIDIIARALEVFCEQCTGTDEYDVTEVDPLLRRFESLASDTVEE